MGINYLGNLWENMDIKYPYLRKEVSKWIKSIHLYKIAAECLLFPASGWQDNPFSENRCGSLFIKKTFLRTWFAPPALLRLAEGWA
jgi:hypothetical protein